jgi:hypothetical protein
MEFLCFCEQIFKPFKVANVLLYAFRFSIMLTIMVVVKMDTPKLYGNYKMEYRFLGKIKECPRVSFYLQAFVKNKNPRSVLWKFPDCCNI